MLLKAGAFALPMVSDISIKWGNAGISRLSLEEPFRVGPKNNHAVQSSDVRVGSGVYLHS